MHKQNKILFIIGPTATGKTRLSLTLAQKYDGEIISADSMQVYRGMDIGTAKVPTAAQQNIRHHLLDILDPSEEFSVFDFRARTLACLPGLYSRGHLPMVVGGSGLYLQALVDGLAPNPPASKKVREELRARKKVSGLSALFAELKAIDPLTAQKIHPHDQRRIIRALEIYTQTRVQPSVLSEKRESLERLGYSLLLIGLERNRATLYNTVNERVEEMIARGLVREVIRLKENLSATTAQAVGYKEMLAHLAGECSLDDAIEAIKKNSRRLVKKQFTWFRKDKRIHWINLDTYGTEEKVIAHITTLIEPWLEEP